MNNNLGSDENLQHLSRKASHYSFKGSPRLRRKGGDRKHKQVQSKRLYMYYNDLPDPFSSNDDVDGIAMSCIGDEGEGSGNVHSWC